MTAEAVATAAAPIAKERPAPGLSSLLIFAAYLAGVAAWSFVASRHNSLGSGVSNNTALIATTAAIALAAIAALVLGSWVQMGGAVAVAIAAAVSAMTPLDATSGGEPVRGFLEFASQTLATIAVLDSAFTRFRAIQLSRALAFLLGALIVASCLSFVGPFVARAVNSTFVGPSLVGPVLACASVALAVAAIALELWERRVHAPPAGETDFAAFKRVGARIVKPGEARTIAGASLLFAAATTGVSYEIGLAGSNFYQFVSASGAAFRLGLWDNGSFVLLGAPALIGLGVGAAVAGLGGASRASAAMKAASIAAVLACVAALIFFFLASGPINQWTMLGFMAALSMTFGAALPLAMATFATLFPLRDRRAALVWFLVIIGGAPLFGLVLIIAGFAAAAMGSDVPFSFGFPGSLTFAGAFNFAHPILLPLKFAMPGDALMKSTTIASALILIAPAFLFWAAAKGLKQQAEAVCPACGTPTPKDAKFCGGCGARQSDEGATAAVGGRPWAMRLATLSVVALLTVAAAGVEASGVLDAGWSANIVWQPSDSTFNSLKTCQNIDCLKPVMQQNGASPEAIRFAQAWALANPGQGVGYATKLHKLGRIDVAEVMVPAFGMEGTAHVALLNKHQISAPLSTSQVQDLLKQAPQTQEIWGVYPNAIVWSEQAYIRSDPGTNGGQRLVFNSMVLNGCHACDVIGQPEVAYDFDKKGKLLDQVALPASDSADWRMALAKERQAETDAAAAQAAAQKEAEDQAYAKLMATFDATVQQNPQDPNAYSMRCWTRAQAGRDLPLALVDCNTALTLQPDNRDALMSRGLIYLRMGKNTEAIKDFSTCFQQSALPFCQYGRGMARSHMGATVSGQADMQAAAAQNSTLQNLFNNMKLF